MKIAKSTCLCLVFVAVAGLLLTGCLFRRGTDSTRYFVLSPISTNEPAAVPAQHLSVAIAFIKMPDYLLRNSMAVRNGANEIRYLDDARWSERLDQNFQRILAANLSRLLASDSVFLSDWVHDRVTSKVSVHVQQFDVDAEGRGTLIAQWRITPPEPETPSKSGEVRLVQPGTSPRGHPEAIAATLSQLTAELSRELAQSLRESPKPSQGSGSRTSQGAIGTR